MAIFPQGYQNIAARCRNTEDGGADRLVDALADGVSPADIGILARRHDLLDPVEKALHLRGIRTQRLQRAGTWEPDSLKLTTLHASKGLEFHTVAIVGLQAVPDAHHSEEEEWRLLYVAMTRATYRLVLGACGESGAVEKVASGLGGRHGGEFASCCSSLTAS